jgi:hypothetical protein
LCISKYSIHSSTCEQRTIGLECGQSPLRVHFVSADQLRQDPQLGFLEEMLVFTGHGERKSKVKHGVEGLVDVADTMKGLSGSQQKTVLAAFKYALVIKSVERSAFRMLNTWALIHASRHFYG